MNCMKPFFYSSSEVKYKVSTAITYQHLEETENDDVSTNLFSENARSVQMADSDVWYPALPLLGQEDDRTPAGDLALSPWWVSESAGERVRKRDHEETKRERKRREWSQRERM